MRRCGKKIKSNGESGFTLVEIMAAVTILALISSIAFVVVFGAVKRSLHLEKRLDLKTEAASVVKLLGEDLRSAYLQEGIVPYFEGQDVFSRDVPTDRVALLTTAVLPVSPERNAGSVGEVEYLVEEGEEGELSLVRREESPAEAPFDEGGTSYNVTERLKSLDLAYSDGEEWFDTWDSQIESSFADNKLPKKVRIEVTLKEGDLETTQTIIVAPVMAVGR